MPAAEAGETREDALQTKIRLMLTRREGVSDPDLAEALRAEAARLDGVAPGRLEHRRGFEHPDHGLYALSRGAYYAGGPPFDAMMEIVLAAEDLERASEGLDGFSDRSADLIQPEHSAAVVGVAHDILPGSAPIQMAIGARRLPSFTHQGYIDYWFGDHSNEARATDENVGGMAYRQIHVDLDASASLARRAGLAIGDFDGMPEVYFADRAAMEAIYLAPGVWEHAFADEQRFVDHSRSIFSLLLMADD